MASLLSVGFLAFGCPLPVPGDSPAVVEFGRWRGSADATTPFSELGVPAQPGDGPGVEPTTPVPGRRSTADRPIASVYNGRRSVYASAAFQTNLSARSNEDELNTYTSHKRERTSCRGAGPDSFSLGQNKSDTAIVAVLVVAMTLAFCWGLR